MKLKVNKNNNEMSITIDDNGTEKEFDYIELINELYNQNKLEQVEYDDSISDWEKKAIDELVKNINDTVVSNTQKQETDTM